MRSRCMSLLPRTTLHSDSEQLLITVCTHIVYSRINAQDYVVEMWLFYILSGKMTISTSHAVRQIGHGHEYFTDPTICTSYLSVRCRVVL
jgi:hypothetical protein